ncbi:MAG: choice-of-anchor M domain-containing protein [Verrucomicrobiota bacterium]
MIDTSGFREITNYRCTPMGPGFLKPASTAFLAIVCWASLLVVPSTLGADPALSVSNRIAFARQHVDIRTVFQTDAEFPMTVRIRDGDRGVNHPPTNVVLKVVEATKLVIPAGFETFGPEGSPLWVLPQSQDPAILYLGFSAEGFPSDRFSGRMRLELKAVRGPGHVFVWQADAAGGIDLRINSRDGLDASDVLEPLVDGHDHYNVGFTTAGLYELVFQPSARPLGSDTFLVGESVPVLFAVEPLPILPPPPTLWQSWIDAHWPGGQTDPAKIAAGADPDRDGEPNVAEFLCGTDPRDASSRPVLKHHAGTGFVPSRVFELPVVTERLAETEVRVEGSPTLAGPWAPLAILEPNGNLLRWEDSFAAAPDTRFYRRVTTKR